MADKRITDVDFVDSLNSDESFFVNKNNSIKQINKGNIVFGIANGGTGATDALTALKNLIAENCGDELPPEVGNVGRVFFKKAPKENKEEV